MSITASIVKELREKTGVGMMDCKKALVETKGDIDAAITLLRTKGQMKAAKKANRSAAEGVIAITENSNTAVLIEINCETDFVARDENFQNFTKNATDTALQNNITDIDVLKKTLEESRLQLVSKIGENINIRKMQTITADNNTTIATYSHGGRIGSAVKLSGSGATTDLARDIAMHVAATNPTVLSPDEIPADIIENEKNVFMQQALDSGKPKEIVEKMVVGKLRKFKAENSLLGQNFVKDPSITIEKLLKQNNATALQFVRFEVGEGIEKATTDFAKEVLAQARGA
ncbi:MAG: elongation factor Ts [Thiotrichales bacterium]|nr:MAG: elongation factor Ts [Thiotrichales bacterium]